MSLLHNLWLDYVQAEKTSIANYVESDYVHFFRNCVSLNISLIENTTLLSVNQVSPYSAMINLETNGFRHWIAAVKKHGVWKLTLDERELLSIATFDWVQTPIGLFEFITREEMSLEQTVQAKVFAKRANLLCKKLDLPPVKTRYYVALGHDDAYSIVGQLVRNSGRARFQVIKTYGRFDHIHEYVHVLTMKYGLANPFIDEGLATAFEYGSRMRTAKECEVLLENFDLLFPNVLCPSNFFRLLDEGYNVYALAQIVMRYWIDRIGMSGIRKILSLYASQKIEDILLNYLGPLSITRADVKRRLQSSVSLIHSS